MRNTAQQVGDAVTAARKPGMPLADAVRQVPLAGLAVAFMLGVVFGRRR